MSLILPLRFPVGVAQVPLRVPIAIAAPLRGRQRLAKVVLVAAKEVAAEPTSTI
jgi:hypothetical protein